MNLNFSVAIFLGSAAALLAAEKSAATQRA